MPGYSLARIFVTGEIADVSTSSAVRLPVAEDMEGEVIEVRTVLGGAIATADATITVSKNGSSMGTITVANSSSAEGDIDTLVPTSSNRFLVKGDYLKVATDGSSTNTVPLGFVVTVRR